MWIQIATITSTAAIAVLGLLAKYFHDLRLSQRNERLARVDSQLRELYGPLLALAHTSEMAYEKAFRELYRPDIPYWDPPPDDPERVTTPEEVAAFHYWTRSVFMPLNRQKIERILKHTDLLVEDEMPDCILQLFAHVSAYEGILQEWEQGNDQHHTPTIRYPREILK